MDEEDDGQVTGIANACCLGCLDGPGKVEKHKTLGARRWGLVRGGVRGWRMVCFVAARGWKLGL